MIFQKIFSGPPRPPDGGGEKPEKYPDPMGQPQHHRQDQTAEGKKVQPAPQGHGGHVIDANLSVVPEQGEGEQGAGYPQPKQQVQPECQPAQAQTPAQSAHSVIDKAQRRPQKETLPKDDGLGHDIHVHGQRSSRARKPPRFPPPSSS
mgnify:CR=1 FL=1